MLSSILSKRYTGLIISLTILTVYLPVCYSDYVYLDEAHQLWHNNDHSNYSMFLVQGRWLSGLLFDKVFSLIATISDLKRIRIFSFISWVVFLLFFFRLGNKWRQLIGFDNLLLLTSGVYIACSLSVAIYIGWASCFQAGIAILLGVWSGSIIFTLSITKEKLTATSITLLVFSALLGLASLFLYQIAFGAFLIPFALYLISKKSSTPAKTILSGLAAYVAINLLYYVLFLITIHQSGVTASERTNFSLNIFTKLGFFFGMPLSQAFSFNFLYNTHSILSQAFPLVMIVLWLVVYIRRDKAKLVSKFIFIVSFIFLCMLIYLPLLLGKENFSSYRTMFAFNLVVSFLLMDAFFSIFKQKNHNMITLIMMTAFAITACWNFRFNYIGPLKNEYLLVNKTFVEKYHTGIDSVYFLRPPENAFLAPYGITSYKDEFGVPSTFKDWTPEPLIKQLVWEQTKHRETAARITVIQFTERPAFDSIKNLQNSQSIFFDAAALFTKQ